MYIYASMMRRLTILFAVYSNYRNSSKWAYGNGFLESKFVFACFLSINVISMLILCLGNIFSKSENNSLLMMGALFVLFLTLLSLLFKEDEINQVKYSDSTKWKAGACLIFYFVFTFAFFMASVLIRK